MEYETPAQHVQQFMQEHGCDRVSQEINTLRYIVNTTDAAIQNPGELKERALKQHQQTLEYSVQVIRGLLAECGDSYEQRLAEKANQMQADIEADGDGILTAREEAVLGGPQLWAEFKSRHIES